MLNAAPSPPRARPSVPRLGFLGTGWIGRHRLQALLDAGAGDAAAVADPSDEALAPLRDLLPDARFATTLDELLEDPLDGLVIATPSALHAAQTERALEAGVPVFCQKPLGRDADEVRRVVETARAADRLLGVDMCYRHTAAMRAIRALIDADALGTVYAADLVFHNAYGPDKEWFYDRARSGGGCVMDLGVHLVDLALWTMGGTVRGVHAALFAKGTRLAPGEERVEDAAEIRIDFDDGRCARVACSWNLHAGRDAVIEARFHGTRGGAALLNRDGSFYDFQAEHYDGTSAETLVRPPDDWGGRAVVAWAERLAEDPCFDPAIAEMVRVAEVLDRVYAA